MSGFGGGDDVHARKSSTPRVLTVPHHVKPLEAQFKEKNI